MKEFYESFKTRLFKENAIIIIACEGVENGFYI